MRNSFLIGSLLVLLVMFVSAPAQAETERNWTAHAGFGFYSLDFMDDEFDNAKPYDSIFGGKKRFYFNLGAERFLWQGIGTVGIESALGYFKASGKGKFEDGTDSEDSTTFNMLPLKLSVVYRFDYLWQDFSIPFVPFAKLGLDYHIWWIKDDDGGTSGYEGSDGYGGTFGFHVSYGLQFCLDMLDKRLANEFDRDVGVNNTYLYVEGTFSKINDFWAGDSFDLSSHHLLAGILFDF